MFPEGKNGRLSWNLGASTSWNPQGLSRPVMGLLYLTFYIETLPNVSVTQRRWQTSELIYRIGGVVLVKERAAVTQKSVPVPLCRLKYPTCPRWNWCRHFLVGIRQITAPLCVLTSALYGNKWWASRCGRLSSPNFFLPIRQQTLWPSE